MNVTFVNEDTGMRKDFKQMHSAFTLCNKKVDKTLIRKAFKIKER